MPVYAEFWCWLVIFGGLAIIAYLCGFAAGAARDTTRRDDEQDRQ